ncbi:MAG: hypothetical protein J5928_04380 [Firmicutes bacterium]|nr:hypothetical protein [Bacillota bacterium]
MKYIKDFFYNLSDLFIIILILAIAGGLIYWRVGIIMDYPEALAAEIRDGGNQSLVPDDLVSGNAEDGENAEAGENANSEGKENSGENANGEGKENSGENANSEGKENAEPGENEEASGESTEGEQNSDSGPRDNTIWKDGKLRVDMTVELESGSSETAVESLVKAGLFESYESFVAICESIDLDPGMVMALTYTFPAGSTQEDIARQVTIE